VFSGPIGPEHSREFLNPFVLCSILVFAWAIEDGTIADLSLTIAFRIIGHGESAGDLILSAEAGHLIASKVCHVV